MFMILNRRGFYGCVGSIGIRGFEEGLVGCFVARALVGAELGLGVCLGAGEESGLAGFDLLVFSAPGLDGAVLEGSSEGESQSPRPSDVVDLVHAVQVKRGLFFSLSA